VIPVKVDLQSKRKKERMSRLDVPEESLFM